MKAKGKNKSTIFRIFLVPLIAIMLVQSAITIGTLVVRRTASTLGEYSSGMMSRLVENRGVILQNDMNQRWASVREQEAVMDQVLEQFLEREGVELAELLRSDNLKDRLLELLFPECKTTPPPGFSLCSPGNRRERRGSSAGSSSGIPTRTPIR